MFCCPIDGGRLPAAAGHIFEAKEQSLPFPASWQSRHLDRPLSPEEFQNVSHGTFCTVGEPVTGRRPRSTALPIPLYAQGYRNVGYAISGPMGCGKPFTDLVSLRRHRAEYCKVLRVNP